MTAPTSVTATFNLLPVTLSVTKSGTGAGTVTARAAPPHQLRRHLLGVRASGTVRTLTATAAAGSSFAGWTGGGCSGTGTCTVT